MVRVQGRTRETIVERRRQLDIAYFAEKDILDVIILPNRPSVVGGGEHGFLIHYDREHSHEISGFEILDFLDFVPHLYEPGVVPALSMRFDVQETMVSVDPDGTVHRHTVDTGLRGVTLHEALEWAYREYILAGHPRPVASPAEMAA
jgi:hypothetical protein